MNKPWLNSSEVADLLDVSPVTVRRWTDKGVLKCRKTAGGHRRYDLREVQSHLAQGLSLESEVEPQPASRRELLQEHSVSAEFYDRVNMANTVLKLNLSIGKTVSAIESEMGHVMEVVDSTSAVSALLEELDPHQKAVVSDHLAKVVTALQYHDLLSQRLGVVRSALDGINNVFKLSVSDFDEGQRKDFSDELRRKNTMLDPSALSNFLSNLLEDDKPTVNLIPAIDSAVFSPELFVPNK